MARLVTIEDIRLRKKKLAESPAIDDAIENAIEAATVLLEGELNTEFAQATLTHTYRINPYENPPSGAMNELFLTMGLVDKATVVVKSAFLVEDLDAQDALTLDKDYFVKVDDGLVLLSNASFIKFGKGLTIASGAFLNTNISDTSEFFARITYTAGLTATSGLFAGVPDWLKEAAVVATIIIMEQQSPVTKPEFGSQLTSKNQLAMSHLSILLNKHKRYFGAAIKPLF